MRRVQSHAVHDTLDDRRTAVVGAIDVMPHEPGGRDEKIRKAHVLAPSFSCTTA